MGCGRGSRPAGRAPRQQQSAAPSSEAETIRASPEAGAAAATTRGRHDVRLGLYPRFLMVAEAAPSSGGRRGGLHGGGSAVAERRQGLNRRAKSCVTAWVSRQRDPAATGLTSATGHFRWCSQTTLCTRFLTAHIVRAEELAHRARNLLIDGRNPSVMASDPWSLSTIAVAHPNEFTPPLPPAGLQGPRAPLSSTARKGREEKRRDVPTEGVGGCKGRVGGQRRCAAIADFMRVAVTPRADGSTSHQITPLCPGVSG